MDICRRKFGAFILAGLLRPALALPPRPKLLILVLLDQFRPDYLDAAWGQLVPGGLRRIIENGAYCPDCRHLASTYTSSGLATLATGAWPAQHGIVADTWYDLAAGKPVRASEEDLRATTLTAQIVGAGGSRAYICSSDRVEGAIYAGTSAARLYWMDEEGHFDSNEPDVSWLSEYNRQKSLRPIITPPGRLWGPAPKHPL
jgi:hypothetical protein